MDRISLVAVYSVATLSARFLYQQYYRHLNIYEDLNKIGIAIAGQTRGFTGR